MVKRAVENVDGNMANKKERLVGIGVLNWNRDERVTDRYGSVKLYVSEDNGCEETVPINAVKEGEYGELIVVVKETRKSPHTGDLFREIFPTTPKVGDRFVLGAGKVFFSEHNSIGLKPIEDRELDWLDPHKLYQVHFQTVELYFKPILTFWVKLNE